MHAIERRHGDRGPAVELNALLSRPIGIHCHEGVRPVGRHGRARFQQLHITWNILYIPCILLSYESSLLSKVVVYSIFINKIALELALAS